MEPYVPLHWHGHPKYLPTKTLGLSGIFTYTKNQDSSSVSLSSPSLNSSKLYLHIYVFYRNRSSIATTIKA
uniref:Uncharacterized protein n=1 Tax=Oryza brachyantha TaxID=4533 RepID=J3N7K5_ORYBR